MKVKTAFWEGVEDLRTDPACLCFFLGMYAPAPDGLAPDDWYHNAELNAKAWATFLKSSEERGYYAAPARVQETVIGIALGNKMDFEPRDYDAPHWEEPSNED